SRVIAAEISSEPAQPRRLLKKKTWLANGSATAGFHYSTGMPLVCCCIISHKATMSDFLKGFEDPAAVARYAENPPRYMPGYADVQRMAAILLAERVADSGTVLVLGAGGGLEMKVFAE